ncbi:MAG: NTP transferase domain-containing protein [Treponema sp.]|jgi:mannose-1-phosphate guanylyltransferase/mannose-1-phosphate guanylyltransferase/mannose-6-phosphate isomerase|nr:NTP transferase domain-containing protein [Treponema sp.]
MFDDCVIMAGGSGTRLWPASSSRLPKQFLPISEKDTFFSTSVKRALSVICKKGYVIIIAGKPHIPHVISDIRKLKANEKKRIVVISEPAAKNTAAAIACAVKYSLFNGSNRNMLVLTSDHIINPLNVFKTNAAAACASAKDKKLVVFGVPPLHPETGYGYIEAGKIISGIGNVVAFHEKPDLQTAKKYVKNKHFFWNSGMFAFSAEFMADVFHRLAPGVIAPFEKLKKPAEKHFIKLQGVRVLNSWPGIENAYKKTKSISFDYAIAEKCTQTVMVKTGFEWIDIGNWEEYSKISLNNSGLVFNASGESCYVDSDIPVALAGVEDLIIVIRSGKNGKPASALITRKGQTQKVREVVEQIKKSGYTELL